MTQLTVRYLIFIREVFLFLSPPLSAYMILSLFSHHGVFCQWCMHLTGLPCHRAWQVKCQNQWHSSINGTLNIALAYMTCTRWTGTSQSHPFLPISLVSDSHSKHQTKAKNSLCHFHMSDNSCSFAFCPVLVIIYIIIHYLLLYTHFNYCNWNCLYCLTIEGILFVFASLKSSVKSLSKTAFLESSWHDPR